MFYHAYNGYLNHAYPLDELQPLTCKGMDTWGSFSLTLIDALDTLLIMGNETEFQRAVELVLANADVDANVNVSVFETNIRVVGGLLSAHIMSGRVKGMEKHPGWPCAGPLLDLAEKFARKLLPAFNTETGMPYGTVNLRYGVSKYETPITCTAGIGTFIIEFGTLSHLTGDPMYERVALRALKALSKTRSGIGLVGNHINVNTGIWTATDAGIGAGVDSYFEYLVKGALLFQRPALMKEFYDYEKVINKYVRKEDWFMWVSMTKAQVNFPVFQSLEAFWPGLLALIGKVEDAAKIMMNYDQVNRQYGLPPEFYNLPNREAVDKRSGYPLRPEIVESMMYLYKSTDDPHYLHMAASIIEAIEYNSKTSCGYATVRDMTTHSLEDRMESFFLSETTKYLYLIFDPDNFIHNDGSQAQVISNPSGKCVIYSGGWIFNTEAHPIDPGTLYCCSSKRHSDEEYLQRFKDSIDFVSLLDLSDPFLRDFSAPMDVEDLDSSVRDLEDIGTKLPDGVDFEVDPNVQTETEEESTEAPVGAAVEAPAVVEELAVAEEPVVAYKSAETTRNNEIAQPAIKYAAEAASTSENKPSRKKRRSRKKSRPLLPPDPKSELDERKFVREQIQNLVSELNDVDKTLGLKVDKNNLLKMLTELGAEYSGLLEATERLQRMALSRKGKGLNELTKRLVRKKVSNLVPINEVICEDCCVLTHAEYDSVALRKMLDMIYSRHLSEKVGLPIVPGPICRQWERPDPSKDYRSDIPEFEFFDSEVHLDAIHDYSFSTFAYSRLVNESRFLLTSPPRPFESILQGMGQILTGPVY